MVCDHSSESFKAVFLFKNEKEKHVYFHMVLFIIPHKVRADWSDLQYYFCGLNQVYDYRFQNAVSSIAYCFCTVQQDFQIKVCRESPSVCDHSLNQISVKFSSVFVE